LFPNWQIVIHHDRSLLEHPYGRVLVAAEREGLVCLRFIEDRPSELCRAMFWRMRPIWLEEHAEVVACRDMDSLPLPRDRTALESFAASGASVHCLLDNSAHAGLMGGMAAYRVRSLRDAFPNWDEFSSIDAVDNWRDHGSDQIFLARIVWPKVAHRALEHRLHESTVALGEVPGIPQDALAAADKLAPYVGAAGFNVEAATAFYDALPATERLRRIEAQTGWQKDRGRTVIVSSDLSPDYYYFLPLVAALWTQRIGFDVTMLLVGSAASWWSDPRAALAVRRAMSIGARPKFVEVEGHRTSTVAQTSRLMGFLACPDQYILTSDADMWPLDKEWLQQRSGSFTVLYANAYGGNRWPICYLGGERSAWSEIMEPASADISAAVQALLDSGLGREATSDANWNFDEQVFAGRLRGWSRFGEVGMIPRGIDSRGMARIDRAESNQAHWTPPSSIDPYIDAHVGRPGFSDFNWGRYLPIFRDALGDAWSAWADEYRREIVALSPPEAVARTPWS
jgi:hypothetical protein